MATVIAIANQKGGVGKTTSTYNFAFALKDLGNRVLAIDADPQASLTFLFGQDERELEKTESTLYYAFVKDKPIKDILVQGNPALVPSSIILSKADRDLISMMRYNATLLREKIREVEDDYDYILIDCPPTLTILTSNALAAADLVLIPVKTDLLSIIGIPLLLEEIENIRYRDNKKLKVWGVLPTLHNAHYTQDKEAVESLKIILEANKIQIFEPIPKSTAYDRASSTGQPTLMLTPKAPGVGNYCKLADLLINHG